MSPATVELKQAALLLKNTAPDEFIRFVNALQALAYEFTVTVTEAAPADILVFQGRAQAARAVHRTCLECDPYPRSIPRQPPN